VARCIVIVIRLYRKYTPQLQLHVTSRLSLQQFTSGPVLIRYCTFMSSQLQLLTGWVSHSRPFGCPQMTWGRTLENALKSKGISKEFDEWIAIAKDRSKWRQLTHPIPKLPDAWRLKDTSRENDYNCITQKDT